MVIEEKCYTYVVYLIIYMTFYRPLSKQKLKCINIYSWKQTIIIFKGERI